MRAAELRAVDADVVRAHARADTGHPQHFGIELWNLEEERAGPFVPVQREKTVQPAQAVHPLGDRRQPAAARLTLLPAARPAAPAASLFVA